MSSKKNASAFSSSELLTDAQSGGHFGTGFFVGLLTGAVGMFLFSSPQGQSILEQLRQELQKQADEAEPELKEQLEQTRTLIAKAMHEVKDRVDTAISSSSSPTHDSSEFPKFKRKSSE